MVLKLPLTFPLRFSANYQETIEATITVSSTITTKISTTINGSLYVSPDVTANWTMQPTINVGLLLLPGLIEIDQDIEMLNLIGYIVPQVTVAEVNNPILSQVNLTAEVIPIYVESANANVTVSAEVTTVWNSTGLVESTIIVMPYTKDIQEIFNVRVELTPTINTHEQVTIESSISISTEVPTKQAETINAEVDLSSELTPYARSLIEATVLAYISEAIGEVDYDVEIIVSQIFVSATQVDIDSDVERLDVGIDIGAEVETKFIQNIEATVYIRSPQNDLPGLRLPLTFPLEFDYATVTANWSMSKEFNVGITIDKFYEDSTPKYVNVSMNPAYSFDSRSLLVMADIFHQLDIGDDEFEQILLETGIDIDLIRYGNHVLEPVRAIFQYISFDYTFSTVDDLGPYDAVMFTQDGHEIKRNDIIKYEGEYFSVIYNSIEKISRHTLYVVYGLKKMTDYGLGINITVT